MIERTKCANAAVQKLGYERFKREITISDVADYIGVQPKTLSAYERGKTEAPFWVVYLMAKFLGYRLIIVDKKGKVIYD